jgi:hypothetical protein
MARWRRGGSWPKSASVDPLSQHIESASLGYFDKATIFICAVAVTSLGSKHPLGY